MIKHSKKITTEQSNIQTQSGDIHYLLKRSTARRTITICIDEKADVSVSVPFRAPIKDIEEFIHEKAKWIVAKVEEAKQNRAYVFSKDYEEGHEFLFLGKKYPIVVLEGGIKRSRIHFDGARWRITIPLNTNEKKRKELVKKKMLQWYRKQAEEILGGRIFHYGRIMDIYPKKLAIRTQKRMWGCCDYNTQTIHLNWQIILSPMKVVDYVVVHEMAHLTHPNHSKRFWARVRRFMPDFEEYRSWLKTNFLEMALP